MIAAGEASENGIGARHGGASLLPSPARPPAPPCCGNEDRTGEEGGFSPKSAMETKREGDEKDERI